MNFRKLLYILILFSTLFRLKANAQTTFSLEVGITSNKLDFKPDNNSLKLVKNQGCMINVNMDYKFNKCLKIELSPAILQKNYSLINKNNIYRNINNTYVQLPISIKSWIKVLNKLILSGSSGVYYSYWLKSDIDGVAANVFELSSNYKGDELISLERIRYTNKFNTILDNRSEFGWAVKIGLDYEIATNLSYSLNGHYYRSISDQQKKIMGLQIPRYNKTLAITAGLVYHLD